MTPNTSIARATATTTGVLKQLVLLGGGPAHGHLLAHLGRLGQNQWPGVEVTLVTPQPQLLCTSMLAGLVAGQHARAEWTRA